MPGPVRHRALHGLDRQRNSWRPRLPEVGSPARATTAEAHELLRVLVRRHHHRKPRNRYRELGLPKPRAVFLDDPHDGGFTGTDEPALDDDLGGIPPKTLFQCHSGANGVFDDPAQSGNPANPLEPKSDGSCNSVFPKLTSIPAENKDLVLTYTDAHGNPPLSSDHGVCAGPSSGASAVNAYDWGFCWKVWDALRDCAYDEAHCNYALGDTRRHRRIGRWSDGVPITLLKIQDWAPIRP